jgi:malonyl-CoA O-methyltransferase
MKELATPDNEKHTVLQKEICHRMMERLSYFKINPSVVLDLSCGFGFSTKLLKAHFSNAYVIGLDSSWHFLQNAKQKKTWLKPFSLLQANNIQLPFADESIDFILAHQLIESSDNLTLIFQECFRVLKPNGCILFSTLGPDTFKELPMSLSNHFIDMHDVGDLLLKQGFSDPVMDRDDIVLRYVDSARLKDALVAQGWPLQGDIQVQDITYELIFGQAWRGQRKQSAKEQVISVAKLRESLIKK